ncbi:14618_t:CDS:1, partial [Dentiscutata erythropus]
KYQASGVAELHTYLPGYNHDQQGGCIGGGCWHCTKAGAAASNILRGVSTG